MILRRAALLCIVALSARAGAQASPPADFSGRWVVQPDTSLRGMAAARASLGTGWASTITIAQRPDSFVIEYVFFDRTDLQPAIRWAYPADGREATNIVMMGRGPERPTGSIKWDGAKLIITSLVTSAVDPDGGPPLRTTVVHTLTLESTTTLVVETTRRLAGDYPASTTRTIYRKQ